MKAKNIFKTLATAMLMPAMLLTTACSNDANSIINDEKANTAGKGYAIPVTINVTRLGDATTRATYDDTEKTLAFSSGDQLFVQGTDATAGTFAGTLTWDSGESFSGTIYTANEYSGTADALLAAASAATATLLPSGYGTYGYLAVSGDGYSATLATDATKAFATSKAAAVEQLSLEQASAYSDGFALAPQNAILNFTAVTGEWGSGSTPASSSVSLQAGETTISGSVAPVEGDWDRALANFAIAVAGSASPSSLTLTVDGTSVSLGSHTLTAGKIYNQKCANINVMSPYIQDNEKWLVYGTGEPSGWRLTIAEGATVTLSNVYLNDYAIIAYRGNNTIILADGTTNTIDPGDGVAIYGMTDDDKTLTIKGTGTLIATGGYGAPAIGIGEPEYESCGAITIESTVTLTATAGAGQSKAITTGSGGGTVTIGDVTYPEGANSPFVYPIPVATYTAPTLVSGTLTYNGSAQALVTGGSATNATIYYSTNGGSSWSTSVPTGTNAGSYTVHYKVEPADGYSGGVASTSLGTKTINKANGYVSLSPNSSSGWGWQGRTTSASANISHHGGSLSWSKSSGATDLNVSISGNTLNLSRKSYLLEVNGTVTVTSAATLTYNAASATYTCNR